MLLVRVGFIRMSWQIVCGVDFFYGMVGHMVKS